MPGTAEWHGTTGASCRTITVEDASFHFSMRAQPERIIIADQSTRQAILGVVRAQNGVVEIVDPDDLHQGSEQFFVWHIGRICDVDDASGDESAATFHACQTAQGLAASL